MLTAFERIIPFERGGGRKILSREARSRAVHMAVEKFGASERLACTNRGPEPVRVPEEET
jgi:hypothetical protein